MKCFTVPFSAFLGGPLLRVAGTVSFVLGAQMTKDGENPLRCQKMSGRQQVDGAVQHKWGELFPCLHFYLELV